MNHVRKYVWVLNDEHVALFESLVEDESINDDESVKKEQFLFFYFYFS